MCSAARAACSCPMVAWTGAGLAGTGAAAGLAGEKRAVLLRGEEPSLEGVAGFRGDLEGSLGAGDGALTGEQSRSSSCCEVTRRGLLDGNKLAAAFFTGVRDRDLDGDWNKLAAAEEALIHCGRGLVFLWFFFENNQ